MLKTVSGNQYIGVRLIIYNSPLAQAMREWWDL
jgi:hypothetical protein